MPLSDYLLYQLAKRWPSPVRAMNTRIGAQPGSAEYAFGYAVDQFNGCVIRGLRTSVYGKEVLEIGCGHGGISCFLAAAGAVRVLGIDLNTDNLQVAEQFAKHLSQRLGSGAMLPVTFVEMDAYDLRLEPESFDLVVADNSFEHFDRPQEVMIQAARVLRPGGRLLVPSFSSILSKYALHLKHGLKLPWTQLVFRERTIVRALARMAKDDPILLEHYPGLLNNPERVKDVRKHRDLNEITHRKFKTMARKAGLVVEWFRPIPTPLGHVFSPVPILRSSFIMDVLSTGASACLRKPTAS